jgi:hypothetical protein
MEKRMEISKPLMYALASTVADDLTLPERGDISNGRGDVDYEITVNTPWTPPTQPCPTCHDGDPGEVGEFEFTATLFGLDIDLTKLAQCFYDELESVIMEEIVA